MITAHLPQGTVDVLRSASKSSWPEWYWHIQADNGEIVAASEGYVTKQGAMRGVQALARVMGGPEVVWEE